MQPLLTPGAVANDDFDSALVVSGVPYTSTQDILNATTAADDPTFPCTSSKKYNTVWYRFTPSASQTLVFSTSGSSTGMVVAVWMGGRGSLVNQLCSTATQPELAVTAGTPPSVFGKSGPANGAVNQSKRPSLSWGTSNYASSYQYCYDTSGNDTCDSSWVTATSVVNLPGLLLLCTHLWQRFLDGQRPAADVGTEDLPALFGQELRLNDLLYEQLRLGLARFMDG